jgi:four helix bundle protein
MEEFGYEKLDVWQLAMDLVDRVYIESKAFPKDEVYGMTSQMRRAAASIPNNIAEGYGQGNKTFARHLRIARGSSFELRTQTDIARRQSLLDESTAQDMKNRASQISRMLDGLIRSIDATQEGGPKALP